MGLDAAVALLLALISNAQKISLAIAAARKDGRDNLRAEDWDDILDRDDMAQANQQAALAHAKAEDR